VFQIKVEKSCFLPQFFVSYSKVSMNLINSSPLPAIISPLTFLPSIPPLISFLMLYSFNNTVIANTKTKILTRANASQEFDIDLAVVGTTNGAKLNAVLNEGTLGIIDAPFQSNQLELLKLYPNPSDGIVNLQYYLPELMDGVTVKVYDIKGRLVWANSLDNVVGKTTKELQLSSLKSGNYIVMMSAYKNGGVKYLSHKMLILK
jgi:hypothetical protein